MVYLSYVDDSTINIFSIYQYNLVIFLSSEPCSILRYIIAFETQNNTLVRTNLLVGSPMVDVEIAFCCLAQSKQSGSVTF